MDSKIIDCLMIGAGPSSLTASIYTTREEISTVVYEKAVIGGLTATTDLVENYPGFIDGISGMELAKIFQKQAEKFGAKIEFGEVSSVEDKGDYRLVIVDGEEVKAKTVLIATGGEHRKLGIPGEDKFYARGVSYCATCDGAFFKDKNVVVVGGGNSAIQEAIFLTRYVNKIDLLVRSKLRASEVLQQRLQPFIDSGKISVHLGAVPLEIVSDNDNVVGVKIEQAGQEKVVATEGVFIFIGLDPNTQFLENSAIKLDDNKHIITNENLETSVKGVFASGDVRSGSTAQIAAAVGEGAKVALSIRQFLEENN